MDPLIVVATRPFIQGDIEYLKRQLPTVKIIQPHSFNDETILNSVKNGVDVFLGPPPSRRILDYSYKTLKLIQIPWTGLDLINFDNCRELEVICANSHGNALVVAEMALSLLLSAIKHIPFHDKDLRVGKWHRPESFEGFTPPIKLSGKTIGFFGFGAINKALNKLLSGFSLSRIACVRTDAPIVGIDKVYPIKNLHDFLSAADFIVVGAPLTDETYHIFDSESFSAMKANSCFVNVSRHGLVNEEALYSALLNGNIGCAASDVWSGSPSKNTNNLPSECNFESLSNMVLSPHRAGFSEGELPHLSDVVTNIRRINAGKQPLNIIDLQRGY